MQYRILMIDDDTELLKMLRSYFELKNYAVVTAEIMYRVKWEEQRGVCGYGKNKRISGGSVSDIGAA